MTNLLTQRVPATDNVFYLAHSTEDDFINHCNQVCTSKSMLPEWALKQVFSFLKNHKPDGIVREDQYGFLPEFFVTHRGAAMGRFFDNIVHQDVSSGQYLIYTP